MVCIMIIGYIGCPFRENGQYEKESGFTSTHEKNGISPLGETPLFFTLFIIHIIWHLSTKRCQRFMKKSDMRKPARAKTCSHHSVKFIDSQNVRHCRGEYTVPPGR